MTPPGMLYKPSRHGDVGAAVENAAAAYQAMFGCAPNRAYVRELPPGMAVANGLPVMACESIPARFVLVGVQEGEADNE